MKRISIPALLAILLLAACNTPFKKTVDGTEYKIVKKSGGELVGQGNFIEMSITDAYKDSSLYNSSDDGMTQFVMYDTTQFPEAYKQIFANVHVGDSIITRTLTDSLMSKGGMAPFMKKGEYLYRTYTIRSLYKTQEEADKARTAMMEKSQKIQEANMASQGLKEEAAIKEYLKKNNITATRAPKGTYVQVLQEGTGPQIDSSMFVMVNYTGKTMAGKMFDSNTDPSKGHVEPFMANMTNNQEMGGIIPGWKDGLTMLKVGSKAKLYIPSTLAYGKQGSGEDIGANETLVFDVEVLKNITEAQAKAEMDNFRKKMQEEETKYMDSIQKAAGAVGQGQAPPQGN